MDRVKLLASQNAAVIFSMSTCCMCHSIKRLFRELGVNSAIYELDEEARGREMERALIELVGRTPAVPAVYVGGRLVGSTNEVMAHHLNRSLVPMLKEAGALWL